MSFAVLAEERTGADSDVAGAVQELLLSTLRDDAVRREVFEEVRYELDEISMVDIHEILDGLIRVLKGGSDE
jgi:hypothetical protein